MPSHRPIITGERVYLRRPSLSDTDEYMRYVRRSRPLHRPWVWPSTTAQGYGQYVARGRHLNREHFFICRRDGHAIVGMCNVSEIIRGSLQSAFMGYHAHADYAGQGFMTEGVSLVLDHVFRTLKLHRIEANIQPANTSSERLVERLGFTHEGFSPKYLRIRGQWKDHNRWAITADQWL